MASTIGSAARTTRQPAKHGTKAPPPLVAGDHLSLEEFLRRWDSEPRIKFAELINGVVHMPSPLSRLHGRMDDRIAYWLVTYCAETPGTESVGDATTILGVHSPQPDHSLYVLPEYHGEVSLDGDFVEGAPELIVEICASSAAFDLHEKKELYRSGGVQEYVAVLVYEQEVRWHQLRGKKYQLRRPDHDDVLRSKVFPGLWLAARRLFDEDLRPLRKVSQQGIDSPEHQAFVAELARRAERRKPPGK